jgi:hypothetical protein
MNKIPLKTFWEAVEQQLAAYSADELRSILRGMAQATPPMGRQAFLDKLKSVQETSAVEMAIDQEDLLTDIDDLASEINIAIKYAEPPQDRYEWGEWGEQDEEDGPDPYEEFVAPLAELFDRAEAALDYGNVKLARAAYKKLFETLGLQDDYGRGMSMGDLIGVDGGEAVARYLRAVYETVKPTRRPKVLFEQMQQSQLWLVGRHSTLDDIIQISAKPLPDYDRFVEDWIAFLQKQAGSDADAWLREAIRLSRGTAGLEELARAEGKKRPRAYLDWFAALEKEGRYREVLVAAQQALEKLGSKLAIRAAIADHLCAAAAKLKETEALRAGRWEAFLVKPTLVRLLDLWDAAPAEERATLMQQAAEHVKGCLAHPPRHPETMAAVWHEDDLEAQVQIDQSVLAHAYLLAGEWDEAHQLAAREKVLGWSSSENTQGLVVPSFLVLLSGESPGALPPNLAQLWQSGLQNSTRSSYWSEEGKEEKSVLKRLERAYTEKLASASLGSEKRKRILSWCVDVANQRVDAIVGNQHRGSYGKAAVLAAACAETLQLQGKDKEADAVLDDVRNRYPRHSAFQSELDAADHRTGRSPKRKSAKRMG